MALIIFLIVFVVTVVVMVKAKADVLPQTSSPVPLSAGERALVWVLCFLNPILAGGVFYYGWKKRLPVKAKQANSISMWTFLIIIILGISLSLLK